MAADTVSGLWSARAREFVEGRSFVLVGIGVNQLRVFEQLGGFVRGVVSVVPLGGPPSESSEVYPVLSVTGQVRNIFDFVVDDYAKTLSVHAARVSTFLDRIDPARKATVVSYLPAPRSMVGGRTSWFPDAEIARQLEDKDHTNQLLKPELPCIPSEPVPNPLERDAWDDACRYWATDRLVLQRLGLNGGGRGTWICNVFESAADLVAEGGHFKWAPYLKGESCNVMGLVCSRDVGAALPPSRQLTETGPKGQPAYAGNVFDGAWTNVELDAIADEVRAFGRTLAAHGFLGPFGLDFIRDVNGRRWYHDINPRMNGAIDSLALYLSEGALEPLRALMLGRGVWSPATIRALERELRGATRARPITRFYLSREVTDHLCVEHPPPGGLWRVDVERPRLEHVGAYSDGSQTPAGRLALLRPTLAAGTRCEPGDRLVLGDLFCSGKLAHALQSRHGPDTQRKLLDALLG